VKSDVSSEVDVRELVQKAIATYGGKLDCAFNNAGIDLLLNHCMNNRSRILTRSCRSMHEGYFSYEIRNSADANQGAGAIVNNSSTNGLVALPGSLSYAASKQ